MASLPLSVSNTTPSGNSRQFLYGFGKTDVLLWSLLLGGINVHIGGRQPILLYFDVIFIGWLFYQIFWCGFVPELTDWVVGLGIFCLLSGIISAIVNYHDIYKSVAALKVLAFGMAVYVVSKKTRPSLLSLSLWGSIAGVLLLLNFRNIQFNEYANATDMKGSVEIVLGKSNYVASMLILLIPIAVAGATLCKGKLRALFVGCTSLMLCGLVATMSRGAMLAITTAVFLSIPLLWRAGLRIKHILLIATLGVGVVLLLPSELLTADAALISVRLAHADVDREELLFDSWKSFVANPLLGVGPGQIGNAIATQMLVPDDDAQYVNAHNLVMNALAENGLLAGIALLSMVGIVLIRALKNALANPTALNVALWIALLASLIHNMVEAPFEGQQFQVLFWMIAAMASFNFRDGYHGNEIRLLRAPSFCR